MRKSKLLTILMITTLLVNSVVFSVSVNATSVNDLKNKQNEVNTKAKTAKEALLETQAAKNQILSEVIELDVELEDVNAEYYEASDALEKTEVLLSQAEDELAAATEKKAKQLEALKGRVRFMYENGRLGYIKILFKSASFSEFLNSIEYINRIVEYDNSIVEQLQATENVIAAKVEIIDTKKKETVILTEQLKTKKNALEEKVATKEALVAQYEDDEQKYAQQMADLEKTSKQIENLIKDAQAKEAAERIKNASVATFSGTMQWPVPSSFRVTSQYGNRIHPISGKKEFHSGIDIGASYGNNVTAAAKGTVIYSGYNGGYGKCVIIEHGSGLSTLYGHNSKLVVSAGDYVEKGQVIAKIGSTGYSTGNHCHFEVRKNGSPVSPKNYLNY